MSRYLPEERERILREARETLEQRNNVEPEPESWPSWQRGNANDRSIRYGIALADPSGLDRWRADVEAQERRFKKERAAREQREAQIRRQQQQTFSQDQIAVLGQLVADVRHQMKSQISDGIVAMRDELAAAVNKLRDELNLQRDHAAKFGEVLDLPALPIRRRSDAA
jgi:hypothetical protein